ncbi:hypothetical protein [Jannaschia sp. LMIT008]|uniref:hypothetical protein n=1 Tax=Jannaschia maritima TaxID=3032585 RepID=UPI002811C79A|nr:hypothetical protein [Jannaschia sp. LMIT008]
MTVNWREEPFDDDHYASVDRLIEPPRGRLLWALGMGLTPVTLFFYVPYLMSRPKLAVFGSLILLLWAVVYFSVGIALAPPGTETSGPVLDFSPRGPNDPPPRLSDYLATFSVFYISAAMVVLVNMAIRSFRNRRSAYK